MEHLIHASFPPESYVATAQLGRAHSACGVEVDIGLVRFYSMDFWRQNRNNGGVNLHPLCVKCIAAMDHAEAHAEEDARKTAEQTNWPNGAPGWLSADIGKLTPSWSVATPDRVTLNLSQLTELCRRVGQSDLASLDDSEVSGFLVRTMADIGILKNDAPKPSGPELFDYVILRIDTYTTTVRAKDTPTAVKIAESAPLDWDIRQRIIQPEYEQGWADRSFGPVTR